MITEQDPSPPWGVAHAISTAWLLSPLLKVPGASKENCLLGAQKLVARKMSRSSCGLVSETAVETPGQSDPLGAHLNADANGVSLDSASRAGISGSWGLWEGTGAPGRRFREGSPDSEPLWVQSLSSPISTMWPSPPHNRLPQPSSRETGGPFPPFLLLGLSRSRRAPCFASQKKKSCACFERPSRRRGDLFLGGPHALSAGFEHHFSSPLLFQATSPVLLQKKAAPGELLG